MKNSRRAAPRQSASGRRGVPRVDRPSPAVDRTSPVVVVLTLLAFASVFAGLQLRSYTRTSATFDEPGSLAAGYAALTLGDYRPAIEHPPLTRLFAALPIVRTAAPYDPQAIDASRPENVAFQGPFAIGHRFLYSRSGAAGATPGGDRLLYRARFMNVWFGVLLGLLVFAWTHEWLGFRAAAAALVLFTVEPNVAAHASLVTTDAGVACFIFGTLYFLWRFTRAQTLWNIAGLTACFVLAVLSKFSAMILGPIALALLLVVAWRRKSISFAAVAGIVALLALATWIGVWAIYAFRYEPSATPGWRFALHAHPAVQQAVPSLAAVVGWIDAHRLLPNAFSEGFLHGQGLVQGRPSFVAGSYSNFGWWYYFPVAFAIKTPLALLLLFFVGLVAIVRRGTLFALDGEAFVILPIAVFMAVAMASSLNIGLRHLLPIYPFVIVVAALAAKTLLDNRARNRSRLLAVILAAGVLEFASVYPNNLAFFNRAAGGPSNGFRWLSDSNIDWGQDLKPLKAWMDRNGVAHINLAYFGVAEPAYYGIDCTYMGGTTIPGVTASQMRAPRLPGYVAVSVTLLNGVPFAERDRDFYKPLRDRVPAAEIGGSIRVYWVERPWR